MLPFALGSLTKMYCVIGMHACFGASNLQEMIRGISVNAHRVVSKGGTRNRIRISRPTVNHRELRAEVSLGLQEHERVANIFSNP